MPRKSKEDKNYPPFDQLADEHDEEDWDPKHSRMREHAAPDDAVKVERAGEED
jgi:hypothetical protein